MRASRMGGQGGQSDPNTQMMAAGAGNPNSGQIMKDLTELHERAKRNNRGVEWGQTEDRGSFQHSRIEQWMRTTGWDGDLRWPPPGFLEEEAERNNGLDSFENKHQRDAGYFSGSQEGREFSMMPLSPLQAHQQRCQQLAGEAHTENVSRMAGWDKRGAEERQRSDSQRQQKEAREAEERQRADHER